MAALDKVDFTVLRSRDGHTSHLVQCLARLFMESYTAMENESLTPKRRSLQTPATALEAPSLSLIPPPNRAPAGKFPL